MPSAVLSSRQFGRWFGRWFPCRPHTRFGLAFVGGRLALWKRKAARALGVSVAFLNRHDAPRTRIRLTDGAWANRRTSKSPRRRRHVSRRNREAWLARRARDQ